MVKATHGGVELQEIKDSEDKEIENKNDESKSFADDAENSTESTITMDDVVNDATVSVVDKEESTNPLKDDKVSNASESDVLEKNTNEVERDAVSTMSQLFLLSTTSDIEQDIELEPATTSIVKPEVYDEGDFSSIPTGDENT